MLATRSCARLQIRFFGFASSFAGASRTAVVDQRFSSPIWTDLKKYLTSSRKRIAETLGEQHRMYRICDPSKIRSLPAMPLVRSP